MKIIIKFLILLILLVIYVGVICIIGDYKILEIIMFCLDIASLSIIGAISIILMVIGLKKKNKFLVEDASVVFSIIYDFVYLFILLFQIINNDNTKVTSFIILLIPIINGLFISILMSLLMKRKDYEE